MHQDIIIIGGGAAGFFAAINAKIMNPDVTVTIIEQSKEVLNKVRISGGGRCNATHACFDPKLLTNYYPRGKKELLGPFHVLGANDTVKWFEHHGVKLYTEPDGCMFPVSNTSDTIIQCFLKLCREYGIRIINNCKVKDFIHHPEGTFSFEIISNETIFYAHKMMLATGSSPFIWKMMESKGYQIVPPCPSLFTFNLPSHPITKLMGLVVTNAVIRLADSKIETNGPILITHWGLSGPAVLKASAWGATLLASKNYDFTAIVDWIPDISENYISTLKETHAKKKVSANPQFGIPTRLWQFLMEEVLTDKEKNWASLTKNEVNDIIKQLKNKNFRVQGKTTFKEEFVTAGGISLSQINFKTFESKLHPGLYMAGEVIDIDAVTGGFNFQAAWTGGFIAARAMTSKQ
ncbi:MAG: NAD(P)/FAD-dependent oxidoreductase [Saprospiraceae bacterium]|nr:NAD(P)/FAD-dependent oxidoreductase [Saprospiraceae bacterium]